MKTESFSHSFTSAILNAFHAHAGQLPDSVRVDVEFRSEHSDLKPTRNGYIRSFDEKENVLDVTFVDESVLNDGEPVELMKFTVFAGDCTNDEKPTNDPDKWEALTLLWVIAQIDGADINEESSPFDVVEWMIKQVQEKLEISKT